MAGFVFEGLGREGVGRMRVRVLGAIEVWDGAEWSAVGSTKQRSLLALLVAEHGAPVSVDRLVDGLWEPKAPRTAVNLVQQYVRGLRRAIGDHDRVALRTQSSSYQLALDDAELDALAFERLAERGIAALSAGDTDTAAERLTEALALWRGRAFADVPPQVTIEAEADRLELLRLTALESRIETDLRSGRHASVAPELRTLVDTHPLRERFWGQLMLALYRCGRQAEALEAYQRLRRLLDADLGVTPTASVRELYQQILNADPALEPPMDTTSESAAEPHQTDRTAHPVPRQLPAGIGDFVGRDDHLAQLDALLPTDGRRSLAPVIIAITGTAGIGKTALAVHWAHRLVAEGEHQYRAGGEHQYRAEGEHEYRAEGEHEHRAEGERDDGDDCGPWSLPWSDDWSGPGCERWFRAWGEHRPGGDGPPWARGEDDEASERFPDGQLYVNLRGFDPSGQSVPTADAIRGFLDALGVSSERIPPESDAQAALYRSVMADRRMLIVLDNARDADHVRPLLPGSPGCLVLVTSRRRLSGLVAADGAHPVVLDLLTPEEAWRLLEHRLGWDRVAIDSEAAADIITACARLPLALAIVAARAATYPDFSLAELASELRDAHGGLDALAGDDPATDVRAVFSWSYQWLTPEAARLFRLLGLHPGPDIVAAAAASLAGIDLLQARRLLTHLSRAHLIDEYVPGRYAFHDLLRSYAGELAGSDPDGNVARERVLQHYVHTANRAAMLMHPHRDPIALGPLESGVVPEDVADQRGALAWFARERGALLAAVDQAAELGMDADVWALSWSILEYLDRRGHWRDQATTQLAALRAAERLADREAQAIAHRSLAAAYTRFHRSQDARHHLQRALDLSEELGDRVAQAHTHRTYSWVFEQQGDRTASLRHSQRAFDLFRAAGHRIGQATALNDVGWHHAHLGNYRQALADSRQALALFDELGHRHGMAPTLESLGYAHHHLGELAEAIVCYRRALAIYRELGIRYYEAETLTNLGDSHDATGDLAAARVCWRHALEIFEELDHPDAAQARAKLDMSTTSR